MRASTVCAVNVCSDLILKYGAAYFITMHAIGVIMYWSIYVSLRMSGFDLMPYLKNTSFGQWALSFLNADAMSLLESGGTLAAALLLNRLLSPVRLLLVLLALPRTAPLTNAMWAALKQWCQRKDHVQAVREAVAPTVAEIPTTLLSPPPPANDAFALHAKLE